MDRTVRFVKSQGTGNDFIIIDDREGDLELPSNTVARLCHRHFGIGADGLIFVRSSQIADFTMKFFNPDGSEAEMCGNGIRCFARYLFDHRLTDREVIDIETKAGTKQVSLVIASDQPVMVRVDLGEPSFDPADMHALTDVKEMIDFEIQTKKGRYLTTCLSMGNPHCIIFTNDLANEPVQDLGPLIECLPLFQERTNVEFVQVLDESMLKIRVWERGAGETLACGTGAAAATVAAAKLGKTGRRVRVELSGGSLEIEWAPDNHVFITGPAEEVFRGEFALNDFVSG